MAHREARRLRLPGGSSRSPPCPAGRSPHRSPQHRTEDACPAVFHLAGAADDRAPSRTRPLSTKQLDQFGNRPLPNIAPASNSSLRSSMNSRRTGSGLRPSPPPAGSAEVEIYALTCRMILVQLSTIGSPASAVSGGNIGTTRVTPSQRGASPDRDPPAGRTR
jgi:hypothetical protein